MAGNERSFDVVKLMVNIRLKSINLNARDMVIWLLDTLQKIAILGPLFDTRVVYANASFTPQVLRSEFGSGAPC